MHLPLSNSESLRYSKEKRTTTTWQQITRREEKEKTLREGLIRSNKASGTRLVFCISGLFCTGKTRIFSLSHEMPVCQHSTSQAVRLKILEKERGADLEQNFPCCYWLNSYQSGQSVQIFKKLSGWIARLFHLKSLAT